MNEWQSVERPWYIGKHRDEKIVHWNKEYGSGNWRFIWKIGNVDADFLGACALYEDAYFNFLYAYSPVAYQLIHEASNVYDDQISNIESGFDYTKQETNRTHIQDIAIRRSLLRLGVWFKGKESIRIRQEKGNHPLSMILSPGKVPFHRPDLIIKPEVENSWWDLQSVESFYQSNRFLQVKCGQSSRGLEPYL